MNRIKKINSGYIRIPNFNDNFKGKAPDMGSEEKLVIALYLNTVAPFIIIYSISFKRSEQFIKS